MGAGNGPGGGIWIFWADMEPLNRTQGGVESADVLIFLEPQLRLDSPKPAVASAGKSMGWDIGRQSDLRTEPR